MNRLLCALFGHASEPFGFWNGYPVTRCRRCHHIRHLPVNQLPTG